MRNRLAAKINEWQSIGASGVIIESLQQGVKFPISESIDSCEFPNKNFSDRENIFIDKEITDLLLLDYIQKCDKKPYCVSPINCVPKKKGDFRLITYLRYVNSKCIHPKFSNEDSNDVIEIVRPKDYVVTADLKNGFYHLPVHKEHQELLGFQYKNIYYKWTVLPFGHCCSPYFFNKILRPVISFLRSKGFKIVLYVDDFILFGKQDILERQTQQFIQLLEDLGWTINFEKSSLKPELSKRFIGYIIDNTGLHTVIRISSDRIRTLNDISRALRHNSVTARGLARIAGECVSMSKCIIPAKLLLRNAYRLLATRSNWAQVLTLDEFTRNDLQWWFDSMANWNALIVVDKNIDVQLKSDASGYAWGACIPGQNAQGFWSHRVAKQSSNYRELLAVLMGLLSFREQLKDKKVQILSDNVTTVAFINGMGGSVAELDFIARSIHLEALEINVTLSAKYLSGPQNWQADHLSRIRSTYEWRLHLNLFRMLDSRWGPHQVDRFASLTTTQLPRYNSLYWDPLTSGVDALAQKDWENTNNYVNPPFALIAKVVQVLRQQKATATLIAPKWEGQPWFQEMMSMLVDRPIKLPISDRTVYPAHPRKEPLKNHKWKIYAWRLCGRRDLKV